ncbi:MAG: hypothetical protein ACLPVO_07560 [Desulfomonilaceae bacterium]
MANKISVKSEKPIESFYFNHGGSWELMPNWAEFFVDLGAALASVETDSESLVLAVATPTRAFAANLIALGIVSARSDIGHQGYTTDQHFERLCNLKPGAIVQCLEKEKKYRCEFLGIETREDGEFVKVKLHRVKNEGLRLIPKKYCHKVILSDGVQQIDRATSRKLDIIQRPNFTKHFLDTVSPMDFALQQRLECQIIGRQNILSLEARSDVFAVKDEGKLETGNLNDVLRVKNMIRTGDPFRTEIFTARNGDHLETKNDIPHVTIYDGAYGFLKFGSDNKRPIRVAVLDRTEPNFSVASQNISDMFVNRRTREVEFRLNNYLPTGIEILAFMEAQR